MAHGNTGFAHDRGGYSTQIGGLQVEVDNSNNHGGVWSWDQNMVMDGGQVMHDRPRHNNGSWSSGNGHPHERGNDQSMNYQRQRSGEYSNYQKRGGHYSKNDRYYNQRDDQQRHGERYNQRDYQQRHGERYNQRDDQQRHGERYNQRDDQQRHGERYNQRDSQQQYGERYNQRDSQQQYGERYNQRDSQQRHGGYRGARDEDPIFFLSKQLSFLLRHGAEKAGYKLMDGGFLYVDEILKRQQNLRGYTIGDVKHAVESNDKKRFTLEEEEGTKRVKIRANQGHTLEVKNLELTPILKKEDCPVVIHGTYFKAWNSIKMEGLCRMDRNHIHFAPGEPGESGVISGMRKSCEVMIYIDIEKALKDGLEFFRSANNVILTTGNEYGILAPIYFERAMQRSPFSELPFKKEVPTKRPVGMPDDNQQQRKKKRKNKKGKKDKKDDCEMSGDKENENQDTENKIDDQEEEEEDVAEDMENKTRDHDEAKEDVPEDWDAEYEKSDDKKDNISEKDEYKDGACMDENLKSLQNCSIADGQATSPNEKPDISDSWDTTEKEDSKMGESFEMEAESTTNMDESRDSTVRTTEPVDQKDDTSKHGTELESPGPDAIIEDEFEVIYLTEADETPSVLDYLEEQKKPIVVGCKLRSGTEPNPHISTIILVSEQRCWVIDIPTNDHSIINDSFRNVFHSKNFEKVFHGCAYVSKALYKQFTIILDGSNIFDTQVTYNLLEKKRKAEISDACPEFPPKKICGSKAENVVTESCDATLMIEEARMLLKAFDVIKSHFPKTPKKEIFEEVNQLFDESDKDEIRKIRKDGKKNENKPVPKPVQKKTSPNKKNKKK